MRTGRLGLAVGVAISLLLAAVVLWAVGFVGASSADCPAGTNTNGFTGLETPRSVWPPGAECAGAGPGQREPEVAEPIPGIGVAILLLAFAGLATLAVGLALEIRGLRSRAAPGTSAPASQRSVQALAWPE